MLGQSFDPELYLTYRPEYPPSWFRLFWREGDDPNRQRLQVADIGSGMGHASWALARSGVSADVVGIEPDEKMRLAAEAYWRSKPPLHQGFSWQVKPGTGENTSLPSGAMDAVMVASAFHWMKAGVCAHEFFRVLKPRGKILIFEYQFPKALDASLGSLNEWIRRQFNLFWKAPRQSPRGNLRELTRCLQEVSDEAHALRMTGFFRHPMENVLNAGELAGLIFSQSRVEHFEMNLSPSMREEFRRDIIWKLEQEMGKETWKFDFALSGVEWVKIPHRPELSK